MEKSNDGDKKGCEDKSATNKKRVMYKQQKNECHLWLKQKILPHKTASTMSMIEQMLEKRPGSKLEV